jgi:hypothetical protein
MVRRLHIMRIVSPLAGKVLTDNNIRAIRSKASFDM